MKENGYITLNNLNNGKQQMS